MSLDARWAIDPNSGLRADAAEKEILVICEGLEQRGATADRDILDICLVLAVVVNVIYGIDIVYTHLFYIPIILTGVWYPRYAIFLAAALGLIHISCDYATSEAFKIGSFLRAIMFVVVAYVTSYLSLRRDRLFNELQTLNSGMLDMINKIDRNGIIEYVSPSVQTILGYPPEQVKGKVFFDFIHPDEASTVKEKFQSALAAHSSFRLEYRYRCADGRYIWIESLANPIAGAEGPADSLNRALPQDEKAVIEKVIKDSICHVDSRRGSVLFLDGFDIYRRRLETTSQLLRYLDGSEVQSHTDRGARPAGSSLPLRGCCPVRRQP